MTRLRSLNLTQTRITDAGLVNLRGMTELRNLNLLSNRIADAGLRNLRELRQLEKLNLATSEVSDAGLAHIEHLSQLQELNLYATRVTEEGVEKLKQALPNAEVIPRVRTDTYPLAQMAKMTFADSVVEEKFRRIDAVAQHVAQPGWHVRPYRNTSSLLILCIYILQGWVLVF